MNKKFVCLLILILTCNWIVGQEMRDSLEEVVITDTKIERPVRNSIRPVRVISNRELKAHQGKNLDEILSYESGLVVNGSGSNPAAIKNLYLRGAAPGYTLILVDGLPMTDASVIGSTLDLRLFDMQQIDRIEIAKGSQSTLYGSDAIAGVINIITKTGSNKTIQPSFRASYGSYNSTDLGGSVQGTKGKLSYNLGYNYQHSDGISEATNPGLAIPFDKDGSSKNAGFGSLSLKATDDLTIVASLQMSDFKGDYDAGSFVDGSDTYASKLMNPSLQIHLDKKDFDLAFKYNYIETDRSFFTEFGDFIFIGKTHNADLFGTLKLGSINLLSGLAFQQAQIDDEVQSDPKWNIVAPYINMVYQQKKLQLESGLRWNFHSEYGNNLNLNIAPSYMLGKSTRIYASFSTAFKAPALNELYSGFGGNPDLTPQKSKTFETGINTYFDDMQVSLVYFNRLVEDVIVFVSQYENFNEQKDQGIEINFRYQAQDRIRISCGYTFLDGFTTEQQTDSNRTYNLFKRPKHHFHLGLDYQLADKWNINWTMQWSSNRSDLFFDLNTFQTEVVQLRAYLLAHVSANFQIARQFQIFLHLNNIFDNNYFETYGFNTQGINSRFGISATL
ncbi:MAG: TonB-dependent receptor [Bacteroidia bacterium]|nr:TonB-dependent receptor [Bacteroidia bacterium]